MNGSKRALSFAALLLSTSLTAQAVETSYVFASVTGVQYTGAPFASVTGVLVGDTTPTTVTFPFVAPAVCENFFFAMISNPGTYQLTVVTDTEPNPVGTGTLTTFSRCRLDRGP